jgi:hypothetical protein
MYVIILVFCMGIFFPLDASTDQTETIVFGNILGVNGRTKAFSNSDDTSFVSEEHHYLSLKITEKESDESDHINIYCGLKWQCVEYARRWLIENKGLTFDPVENAYMIWDLKYAHAIMNKKIVPFIHCKNGESSHKPSEGDLLIYSTEYTDVTGHVAVIVGVLDEYLQIAEQNGLNQKWNTSYARLLSYGVEQVSDKGNIYSISDVGVIGWLKMGI